ncbi:MAG: DUF721 domain-containing protein [Planctomycetota bacterium]
MREPQAPSSIERGGRPAPLGEAVRRYLAAAGLTQRRKDASIYAAWDEAVGPTLALTARATSFQKGQLVVEVASSALLQELVGFSGEGYRARANQLLASPLIRRVTFRLRRRT